MAWYTLSNLTALVGLTDPTEAEEQLVTDYADQLIAEFEEYAGRKILAADMADGVHEYFDGGVQEHALAISPVSAITDIRVEAGSDRDFDADTVLDSTKYALLGDTLWFNELPPNARHNVRVHYTGGETTLPRSIERAFWDELRREWNRRSMVGIASMSVSSGGSISFKDDYRMSEEAKRVLVRWRVQNPFIQNNRMVVVL